MCKANECVGEGQCPSTQASCLSSDHCGAGTSCESGCCTPLPAGACKDSNDCTDAALPHCDNGACRACAANSECLIGTICTPTGACRQGCTADNQCEAGQRCFDSGGGKYCAQCALSADCSDPTKPTCTGGICTGCSSNADCSGSAPACDTATHKCEVCIPAKNDGSTGVNADCPSNTPVCDTNKTCIACNDSYNGAGNANGACTGANAACLNKSCLPCVTALNNATTGANAACPGATPVCDLNNAGCVGCLNDNHCDAAAFCISKACVFPVLDSLAPATITVNSTHTVLYTVTLDRAARIDTAVALTLTGEGSLDATNATVPAGQTTATFHYTAPATVPGANPVVTATLRGVQKQSTVTVTNVPPALDSITPTPTTAQVNAQITLTVHMTVAVGADTPITLASAAGGSVPASVTVLAGNQTADFVFTAGATAMNGVIVTAHYLTVDKTASIDITPLTVASVTPATPSVMKTGTTQLTVNLNDTAAKDTSVDLTYDATYTSGPATVTVLSGTNSANFTITGVEVTPTTSPVTASLNGSNAHTDVTVTTNVFHVGGTLSGLAPGQSVTLQNNGGNDLVLNSEGAFQFTTTILSGNAYAVTLSNQTTYCRVDNGSGNVSGADVTNVAVSCAMRVMVVRVGDKTIAVTGTPSFATFVDEYDTTATSNNLTRTITLPTVVNGAQNPISLSSSTIEGGLSRSANGRYVVLAGYAAPPGTASIATTSSTGATPTYRVIARVDAAGSVDTSTLLYGPFSGANVRGASTVDGTAFWATGSSGGIWYATLGANAQTPVGTTTQIASSPSNARQTHVYGGQLYESSGSNPTQGVIAVGTGTPTATATATLLNGFPTSSTGCSVCNANSFAVLDLDATPGPETIYETVDAANATASTVNVAKWVLDTSATPPKWNQVPFLPTYTGGTVGTRGLSAFVVANGAVRIFTTTGGGDSTSHLVTFVDDGSTSTPTATAVAAAPSGTNATFFKGVAVSPSP